MKQDEATLRSLARQYNWLRERGESHEDTLRKLHANGGESIRPLLDKLKQAQQGDAKTDPLIAGRLKGLVAVLEHSQADESLRPLMVSGSPKSPISWSCGYRKPPVGMAGIGVNKSSVLRSMVPMNCRS